MPPDNYASSIPAAPATNTTIDASEHSSSRSSGWKQLKAASGQLLFSKMHGAGNDFVVFDGRYGFPFDPHYFAPLVCDRRFGVGADGLIALAVSDKADFRMFYYNADGTPSICGNGIRCLVKFIVSRGLAEGRKQLAIETEANIVNVEVIGKGDWLRVDMGAPIFEGTQIPIMENGKQLRRELVIDGCTVKICAVGMGNPHCVVFVEDLEQTPFDQLGPALENHPYFPQKTNVEFVQALSRSAVKVRVWERGVGETLACGTGACAVVAAGAATGRTERTIQLQFKGGPFLGTWSEESNRIVLIGPAEEVYSGTLDIARLISGAEERANGIMPQFSSTLTSKGSL